MEVRKDLEPVSIYISRLLRIANEFAKNDKFWSHLKNKEDFREVMRIPVSDRYKVEQVYADGRHMALFMQGSLSAINYDFTQYPTLTSIVDRFENTWVNGKYSNYVDQANDICKQHHYPIWSVGQMVNLFKEQEKLLAAVHVTLNILKNSDLYKIENGIEVVSKPTHSINISGNDSSNIVVNSKNVSSMVNSQYNEPEIFAQMKEAVEDSSETDEVKQLLHDNVELLSTSHKSDSFATAYKDFMQNVSAHITVFTPFIAGLSALL